MAIDGSNQYIPLLTAVLPNSSECPANTALHRSGISQGNPTPVNFFAYLSNLTKRLVGLKYFDKNVIQPNRSGIACAQAGVVSVAIENRTLWPRRARIHANEMRFPAFKKAAIPQSPKTPKNQEIEEKYRVYLAGQSPEPFSECEKLIVQGIESGHGVYQFVSRKAHLEPEKSKETPIILSLLNAYKKNNNQLTLGKRYNVKAIDLVNNERTKQDHVHYRLTVIDQRDGTKRTITLTQAGLKFTDAVLAPDQIREASAILVQHRSFQKTHTQKGIRPQSLPLIVSYSGIGRNATLITYHEICCRINNGLITDRQSLRNAMAEVILVGRQTRGAGFIHSEKQLTALEQALQAALDQRMGAAAVKTGLPAAPKKIPSTAARMVASPAGVASPP